MYFGLPIDEIYYKPIRTNSSFDNNYIEYENKRDKDTVLAIKVYLNMIRPYIGDIINYHKIQGERKVHSDIQ